MPNKISAIIVSLSIIGGSSFAGQKISPYLQAALSDRPELNHLVWVEFVDKGPIPQLERISTSLITEKAIERRSKVLAPEELVSFIDVPVSSEYVAAVRQEVGNIRQVSRWFNMVSAVASPEKIEALAQLPFVKSISLVARSRRDSVEQNIDSQTTTAPADSPFALDYGPSLAQLQLINVPPLHDLGNFGQGILICVLDNGFRLLSHEAFASMNIIATYDFVDHKVSVVPNNTSPAFGSHGINTLSALGGRKDGQLIGPAFGASFLLARTENDSSETPIEEDNWVAAIEWAESLGVDVTSTSLGYLAYDPPYTSWTWQNLDGNTTLITRAADMAAALGVVVVNSAGNNGFNATHNTLNAPADGDSVISVGAVTVQGTRASFSSVGPTTATPPRIKPDVMATGVNVYVANGSVTTAYQSDQGTSVACPLAAGVAALILHAQPSATPWQVGEAMRNTASRSSTPDNQMGWGILNAVAAVNYLTLPNQVVGLTIGPLPNISNVQILWSTTREQDNLGFEVQRSANVTQNFIPLANGFVPGVGNSSVPQAYSFVDTSVGVGRWYYRLKQINLDSTFTLSNSIEVTVSLPTTFLLEQNFPNPFNPRTRIRYRVPEQSYVSLNVYNVLGQLVRTLVNEVEPPSSHEVEWNGKNDAGEIVATGVYYYRLSARSVNGDRSFTNDRKMIFLK